MSKRQHWAASGSLTACWVHRERPGQWEQGKSPCRDKPAVSAAPPQFGSHQQSCRRWDSENCKYLRGLIQKDYFGQNKHESIFLPILLLWALYSWEVASWIYIMLPQRKCKVKKKNNRKNQQNKQFNNNCNKIKLHILDWKLKWSLIKITCLEIWTSWIPSSSNISAA